jgi:drug/metabolite transporter (DMT)-like permease
MKGKLSLSLEGWVGLYFLLYLPNVMITRYVTTTPHPELGRPLTGLETLPASLVFNWLITYAFIWLSGWHRDANAVQLGRWRFPVPTRFTFISGLGTALVLFTVPMSLTFQGVSIPFIQLIMRGDILIIAPLVDLMFGRKVRWWSWVALVMVFGALVLTLADRGGLNLPPLAIVTVVLYTIGYFVRLAMMNRLSKDGDPATVRRYFVEEKMIALPLSVAALAMVSALGFGAQAGELSYGFFAVWTDPVILPLFLIGFTLAMIGVVAIIILLDPNENAYCVPLERAASLVAGVGGAVLLAWFFGGQMPRAAELVGAAILIAAIVLLSLAPRLSAQRTRISLSDPPAKSVPEI